MNTVYERDLDLNLLRVFAVVAEEGSVTRAAARLYVTQPAVSAALRRLASFVGAPLFARQGHGVVLTTRGAALLRATREHLPPLVAATTASPGFDPRTTTASVRVGLSDSMESLLLPRLLARLRAEAPQLQLIVTAVQFRTVEEALLSHRVDAAVSVADALPRSILRKPLFAKGARGGGFVCLYDPRFTKLPRVLTEDAYFAGEHVAVSYAGDVRGLIEDALGRSRVVRVSVPAFGHVAEIVDGSPLLATVPGYLAEHIRKTRPHLACTPVPFALKTARLELLWSRVTDDDPAARFVRGLLLELGASLDGPKKPRGAANRRENRVRAVRHETRPPAPRV